MSLVSSHLSAGASEKQEVKSVFRFTILLGSSNLLSMVCWEQVCGDGGGDCWTWKMAFVDFVLLGKCPFIPRSCFPHLYGEICDCHICKKVLRERM